MTPTLQPLQVQSLKQACVARLEEFILSGALPAGERLPSERDLAASLNISRPILHEALVDLASKGLVSIQPRRGVFVNDFRVNGSVAILSSLMSYQGGQLAPAFIDSLMEMRLTMECDTARLAAERRRQEHLERLHALLARETAASISDPEDLIETDFAFHLEIALASGNQVYPLIINSFKSVYTSLTGQFFHAYAGTPVLVEVSKFHHRLVQAVEKQDSAQAEAVMREMLVHGEVHLKGAV